MFKRYSIFPVVFYIPFLFSVAVHADTKKIDLTNSQLDLEFSKSNVEFPEYPSHEIYDVVKEKNAELDFSAVPGMPLLPVQYVRVAVPENARFDSVIVNKVDQNTVSGIYSIFPTQVPKQFNDQTPFVFTPPDQTLYAQTTPFPSPAVTYTGEGIIGGHRFFNFKVHVLQYIPDAKQLVFNAGIHFTVSYIFPTGGPQTEIPPQSDTTDQFLKSIVVNPNDVSNTVSQLGVANAEKVDYLIITSQSLHSEFEPLVVWKAQRGISAKILTVENIATSYTGRDIQEKVRTAIKDYWLNNSTLYVLLGGDDTVVPVRYCTVVAGGYTESIPSDLYYSGLDRDWDGDGNGVFCESTDNVDFDPDVSIGRTAVENRIQAASIVKKVIDYEKQPDQISIDFYKKFLLTGNKISSLYTSLSGYTHSPVSDVEYYLDRLFNNYVIPYYSASDYRLYDTYSDWDTSVAGDFDINNLNLQKILNEGYNFTTMYTHGSPTVWGLESGDNFPVESAASLTNSSGALSKRGYTGIIYTIACLTNQFDSVEPSLSEAFIRNPQGGSVAFIGSSRYGWWHGSDYFAEEFYKQLYDISKSNEYILGRVFATHKQARTGNVGSSYERWLQHGINLLGDPTMKIWSDTPKNFTVSHSSFVPSNASSISIQVDEEDASVVLVDGAEIIGSEPSISGFATVSLNRKLISNHPLLVTVTKNGFRPYSGWIFIEGQTKFRAGDDDNFQFDATSVSDISPISLNVSKLLDYISADPGQDHAAFLDEIGENRPVGLTHYFAIPPGAKLTGAKLKVKGKFGSLAFNDGIFYDASVSEGAKNPDCLMEPEPAASTCDRDMALPLIVWRDILGHEPAYGETIDKEINLSKVPVRTVNTSLVPGGHWSNKPEEVRDLLKVLIDGQLDLVFSDDTTVDFSELSVTYTTAGAPAGDLNGDIKVNKTDLSILQNGLIPTPSYGADDPRDLDHDGKITVLDARKLVLLCTKPLCAVQ